MLPSPIVGRENMVEQISPLLALPAELRLHCLGHLFSQQPNAGFSHSAEHHGLLLDDQYSSSAQLNILLTCRQLRDDSTQLAFRSTTFVVGEERGFFDERRLQSHQIASLRKVAFVVDAPQMIELVRWARYPFDNENVHLDELSVVLYGSDTWHEWYNVFQQTRQLVNLLRRLQNVKLLRFVRNSAPVNQEFLIWYQRLIGLLLKVDHYQRYDAPGAPNVETTWWEWSYDYVDNTFELFAQPPKPMLPEAEYIEFVAPLVRALMSDKECEEVRPRLAS